MIIYLLIMIVINVLGILVLPAAVGKERKPITAGSAAVMSFSYTALLVFATVALLRGWAV